MFAGIACGLVGGQWDISWHMSIGRDTFWTPAHILIQLTGVLVGMACGYMILTATFGRDTAIQSRSVKIWGFRGPLGAFIATWGCVAMLTSAPFDNWWHNAYGLDVKIVSPPHMLLSLGSFAIKIGTLALMAGLMNRSEEKVRRKLMWLFVFVGAVCVSQLGTILTMSTWPVNMHAAKCYLAVAFAIPPALMGTAWGLGRRRACTLIAGTYTLILLAFEWILPLIPAEPKLGPVYQHITHLIPLRFPLLFIVPAIMLDLLWNKTKGWGRWELAAVSGPVFVLSFLAVQWPFANFLMSPPHGTGYSEWRTLLTSIQQAFSTILTSSKLQRIRAASSGPPWLQRCWSPSLARGWDWRGETGCGGCVDEKISIAHADCSDLGACAGGSIITECARRQPGRVLRG